MVLTFESVDEILKCDHSNESYLAVLSYGVIYYAVNDHSNFSVLEKLTKYRNLTLFYLKMLSITKTKLLKKLHIPGWNTPHKFPLPLPDTSESLALTTQGRCVVS